MITLNEPATGWLDRRRLVNFDHRAFWQPMLVSSGIVLGSVRACGVTLYFHWSWNRKEKNFPLLVYDVPRCTYPALQYKIWESKGSGISWKQSFSEKNTASYIFYIIETMKGLIFTLILISTLAVSMAKGEVGEYCGQ